MTICFDFCKGTQFCITAFLCILGYIDEKEKSGELFVIRPECDLPVSRIEKDPEKLKAAYEIGRKTAIKQLEKIKAFLAN